MERIDSVSRRLALHGTLESRRIEHAALSGLPESTLVRRAGESLGRLALSLSPHATQIWVAAGPGNNGADGLHAALWLTNAGKRVCVTAPTDPQRRSPEAIDAWQRIQDAGIATASRPPTLGPQDLAIDALLGLGADRRPQGEVAERIRQLNAQSCRVLAADLPSGLSADTGQPLGDDETACSRATHTLSLLTLHPGLFTGHGRDYAGEVWFDSLGVKQAHGTEIAPAVWLSGPEDVGPATPPSSHSHHKGSFGDVAVVGGAPGMTGAVLLAARAAHAAGAGRVYVSMLDVDAPRLDTTRPELMFRRTWWRSDAGTLAAATVACGCGGGEAVREALPPLLANVPRLVLDADALNAISRDDALQSALRRRENSGLYTVLTPHPLEAARLLGLDISAVQHDRLAAARQLADRFTCIAVLKGSGTVVAAPDGTAVINRSGNSSLGTAGTGDVLAGWLAGTWARSAGTRRGAGESGHGGGVAFDAAVAAVHQHGSAADRAHVATLRANDLIEWMLGERASG